jgi:hypothetical protein
MYNKNKMDNFDLRKYLVENKLSEEASSNQLSAVEWLFTMLNNPKSDQVFAKKLYDKAKEKEIENIKNAFDYGQIDLGMEADEYLDFINFK